MDGRPGTGTPWRAIHGILDATSAGIGSAVTSTFFRAGIESPPFTQQLDAASVELPAFDGPGLYEVQAASYVGTLTPGVRIATPLRADRPTLIYHHGIGEYPFDTSFDRLFRPKQSTIDANLIAIRAPYHRSFQSVRTGLASLANILALQAVSVALIESVQHRIDRHVGSPVVVSGTSLGGFVTNLHHIHHGTADRYVPLLAGLAQDDVFLESTLRSRVANHARAAGDTIRDRLNFEDAFAASDPARVHPLLARYDRIVRYPVQSTSYGGRPITTVEAGHLSGAAAVDQLRDHVSRFVRRAGKRTGL